MSAESKSITFLVPGQEQPADADASATSESSLYDMVEREIRVREDTRGEAAPVEVEAIPGEDIIVLRIGADGPELVLHPETARDLFLAQAGASQRGAGAADAAKGITVPARLQWGGYADADSRASLASAGRV
ncbi:MAG: hypothetical protein LBE59_03905, partial [Nevskiaceae bacterium]|nr:hypothetical protein [Nevskiaceae bacterium]